MKRIAATTIAACLCAMAAAQNFGSILSEIERNNTTLKALRAKADAAKLEARTGIMPDDPEIGLGYLWGKPADQGNRVDVSVSQSFDFPTVYYYKHKIAAGEATIAEYEFENDRKGILLEANKLCIEAVYRNMKARALERRLKSAETIAASWEKKYERGATGVLDLTKAQFDLMSAKKDARTNEVELQAILAELTRMNGGIEVKVDADAFLGGELPADFETWYASAEAVNPELQALSLNLSNSEQGIRLAKSEWLPKFSIGYDSEFIAGTSLQGIAGGISIPLWSARGKVKAAKARQEAAKAMVDDYKAQFKQSLQTKYRHALGLQDIVREYKEKINGTASLEILQKALEGGEISLVEFEVEQGLWFSAMSEAMESERDFHLLLAELNRYAR